MKSNICNDCGKCCKNEPILILEEEYIRILPYITQPELVIYDDNEKRWILGTGEKPCFALGQNGCRIPYKLRPIICRLFPYTIDSHNPFIVAPSRHCPKYKCFNFDIKLLYKDLVEHILMSSKLFLLHSCKNCTLYDNLSTAERCNCKINLSLWSNGLLPAYNLTKHVDKIEFIKTNKTSEELLSKI